MEVQRGGALECHCFYLKALIAAVILHIIITYIKFYDFFAYFNVYRRFMNYDST